MHENDCDGAENTGTAPELTEDAHAVEFHTCWQQESRHTDGGSIQTQKTSTSMLINSKVSERKKLERLTKDIVERNKVTLGRSTSKRGSYVRVHTLRQEMPHNVNKVCIDSDLMMTKY